MAKAALKNVSIASNAKSFMLLLPRMFGEQGLNQRIKRVVCGIASQLDNFLVRVRRRVTKKEVHGNAGTW